MTDHLGNRLTRRGFVVSGIAAAALTGCDCGEHSGWYKSRANPVLGGALGTCFDVCVIRLGAVYRMYFSWRPKKSIAVVESADGIHWSGPQGGAANTPRIVLTPDPESGWEQDINRPVVMRRDDGSFHLWYTGQTATQSYIGYARSVDGLTWTRANPAGKPVFGPSLVWEQVAVMAPHVIWDAAANLYKMWYSGGEQYEPNALGYATSLDGVAWAKLPAPVMQGDPTLPWEQERVTAACVLPHGGWYYAFYIGFRDVHTAAIGIARSRDGISGWQRLSQNPILRPARFGFDRDACYKPSVLFENGQWRLWYNGRSALVEQVGLATHVGDDLGFGG